MDATSSSAARMPARVTASSSAWKARSQSEFSSATDSAAMSLRFSAARMSFSARNLATDASSVPRSTACCSACRHISSAPAAAESLWAESDGEASPRSCTSSATSSCCSRRSSSFSAPYASTRSANSRISSLAFTFSAARSACFCRASLACDSKYIWSAWSCSTARPACPAGADPSPGAPGAPSHLARSSSSSARSSAAALHMACSRPTCDRSSCLSASISPIRAYRCSSSTCPPFSTSSALHMVRKWSACMSAPSASTPPAPAPGALKCEIGSKAAASSRPCSPPRHVCSMGLV
mmetsp:Transcript_122257/g.346602  ORF Transcript_122257/g.346602 Transcript_122257/m.346602 type:complete len:295 (+) Transcript_122257:1032-1916(+)